jgi:hypothetical protein
MDATAREENTENAQEDDGSGESRPHIPELQELKERLEALNDRVQGFIKEHPAACLMGALGLGYLFARIARRRS